MARTLQTVSFPFCESIFRKRPAPAACRHCQAYKQVAATQAALSVSQTPQKSIASRLALAVRQSSTIAAQRFFTLSSTQKPNAVQPFSASSFIETPTIIYLFPTLSYLQMPAVTRLLLTCLPLSLEIRHHIYKLVLTSIDEEDCPIKPKGENIELDPKGPETCGLSLLLVSK